LGVTVRASPPAEKDPKGFRVASVQGIVPPEQ
jgi:hypothetical protein